MVIYEKPRDIFNEFTKVIIPQYGHFRGTLIQNLVLRCTQIHNMVKLAVLREPKHDLLCKCIKGLWDKETKGMVVFYVKFCEGPFETS
jgi:hypothetical protein